VRGGRSFESAKRAKNTVTCDFDGAGRWLTGGGLLGLKKLLFFAIFLGLKL
jgi:hypothetical protein